MDFVRSYFGTNEPLTSWRLFSSLVVHTKQTSQKVRKKVFNWSEVHLYRSNFLQNPYFRECSPKFADAKWPFKDHFWSFFRELHEYQHTQRKLWNFENWCNGDVSKSAKLWLSKSIFYICTKYSRLVIHSFLHTLHFLHY